MIVLDCSAATEIVLGTARGKKLREHIRSADRVAAPALFRVEIHNVFWKYVHAGLLDLDAASGYIEGAIQLVNEFVPTAENDAEAFREAVRLNHSVYDMMYFTLARRNACVLLTTDKKLACLAEEQGVRCATGDVASEA